MRNFLAFVGAMIVVLLGLGWYLGWYSITPQKSEPGQSRLQVDINRDKIGKDVQEGVNRGSEKVQELLEKNKQDPTATPDPKSSAPAAPTQPSGQPSTRAKETFGGLIRDGWWSGDKK